MTLEIDLVRRERHDARRKALEEAARVADRGHCTHSGCDPQTTGHSNLCPVGIAAAIRALIDWNLRGLPTPSQIPTVSVGITQSEVEPDGHQGTGNRCN